MDNEKFAREAYSQERRIIIAAEQWVQSLLQGNSRTETTDHGWYHINLVRRTALDISAREEAAGRDGGKRLSIELITIFHELGDSKLVIFPDNTTAPAHMRKWMEEQGMDNDEIETILDAVAKQSFSTSGLSGEKVSSTEGRIAQDADRLMALGATGVARAMVWAPVLGIPVFDPGKPPRRKVTKESYRSELASVFNFLLESALSRALVLNTASAQEMAKPRVKAMIDFIEQYLAEQPGVDTIEFIKSLEAKKAQLYDAGMFGEED